MTTHWTTLLDEFQRAVKEKKYPKVPYDHWREMKQRDCWVTLTKDLAHQQVKVIFEKWGKYQKEEEQVFFTLDYPFGKFLWDRLDGTLESALNKVKDSFSTLAASVSTDAIATSNVIKSSYNDLNEFNRAYTYSDSTATSVGISNHFYEKQPTIEINEKGLKVNGQYIEDIIDKATGNSMKNRKEKDNMDLIKNFDFGSCANDKVKVSMYGIAVQNAAGTWVSYDPKSGKIIDVDILNFDGKYLYKMPVAIKDIAAGDVVIHNRKPMFVSKIDDGKILAIDPAAGEEKVIMLTTNMFGFDFATKVINLFAGFSGGATADAPFGNMLPLMLMSNGSKSDDMLPLMFMMNGGKMDMSNPMMMYFLMKDSKGGNDMLPFLLMSNFNLAGKCNCSTGENCEVAN